MSSSFLPWCHLISAMVLSMPLPAAMQYVKIGIADPSINWIDLPFVFLLK
jgi:hypothetical protein